MSGHEHDHGAAAAGTRGKLILVHAITFMVMIAEIIGSVLTGSLALLADTVHNYAAREARHAFTHTAEGTPA